MATVVSGVILIDKPKGKTSQQVVTEVKKLFYSPNHNSKKAGHTGTLDRMATGLLPVCLGEATKFSHYQLDADKRYHAIIQLGAQTDTGDAEGEVIQTADICNLDKSTLQQTAHRFMGQQQQIPPMYSAVKKDGKKLYEYAREGIEIKRQPRDITIHELELEAISASELSMTVTCSKGTYVRVLAEDIAKSMGTLGYLTSLRRLAVGDFDVRHAVGISDLAMMNFEKRFDYLQPVDTCIKHLDKIVLTDEQCQRIRHGQRLNIAKQLTPELQQLCKSLTKNNQERAKEQTLDVRLFDDADNFIGLATLESSGRLQPKKLVQS